VRQFLFESFYALQLDALTRCGDSRLREIAARVVKEIHYHLRHVSQWLVRLGDGTIESHDRVQQSLENLWRYTGEMFTGDEVDDVFRREWKGPNLREVEKVWDEKVGVILAEATLRRPDRQWMDSGGRTGRHSEHLGYLIAEMQFLQRAYPGLRW
jgi:ring-1,2-phenylacetyl-CoA epoxidase subunit PaaC